MAGTGTGCCRWTTGRSGTATGAVRTDVAAARVLGSADVSGLADANGRAGRGVETTRRSLRPDACAGPAEGSAGANGAGANVAGANGVGANGVGVVVSRCTATVCAGVGVGVGTTEALGVAGAGRAVSRRSPTGDVGTTAADGAAAAACPSPATGRPTSPDARTGRTPGCPGVAAVARWTATGGAPFLTTAAAAAAAATAGGFPASGSVSVGGVVSGAPSKGRWRCACACASACGGAAASGVRAALGDGVTGVPVPGAWTARETTGAAAADWMGAPSPTRRGPADRVVLAGTALDTLRCTGGRTTGPATGAVTGPGTGATGASGAVVKPLSAWVAGVREARSAPGVAASVRAGPTARWTAALPCGTTAATGSAPTAATTAAAATGSAAGFAAASAATAEADSADAGRATAGSTR